MKPYSIVCNSCRLVCIKFYLNRCRFTVVIAKCLWGSLFWDTVYKWTESDELFHLKASLVVQQGNFFGTWDHMLRWMSWLDFWRRDLEVWIR